MSSTIAHASLWEQEIYDFVQKHIDGEKDILGAYRRLVEHTTSPALAYLAGLVLADEERHHAMLTALADTIRTEAELSGEEGPIPRLGRFRDDRDAVLDATNRFLDIERKDLRELKELTRRMKDVRDTTLWSVLLESMQDDTKKHIRLLSFIRDQVRHRHH